MQIVLRVALVALFFAVLLGLTEWLEYRFACPDPTPPPGLAAEFYRTWSGLVFGFCAIFILMPLKPFQLWASGLPLGLLVIFVDAFRRTGAFDHALYLLIEGIFAFGLALVFKLIAEGAIMVLDLVWPIRLIAMLAAYAGAQGWARVQAPGFTASVC